MTSANTTNEVVRGGSIDEYGLIRDLLRSGFTHLTSWCELIANSYDAHANKLIIVADPNGKIDKPMIYIEKMGIAYGGVGVAQRESTTLTS